jgi:hypothetical protein
VFCFVVLGGDRSENCYGGCYEPSMHVDNNQGKTRNHWAENF